jgi:hypothetical protein
MSRNASSEKSRLQVILRAVKAGSLPGCSLIVYLVIRLPSWALISCYIFGIFALASNTLCEIIPQKSADRLTWWGYVLGRKRPGRYASRPKRRGSQRRARRA